MTDTFLVEIFDENGKDGFDYFTVDRIVNNEGLE